MHAIQVHEPFHGDTWLSREDAPDDAARGEGRRQLAQVRVLEHQFVGPVVRRAVGTKRPIGRIALEGAVRILKLNRREEAEAVPGCNVASYVSGDVALGDLEKLIEVKMSLVLEARTNVSAPLVVDRGPSFRVPDSLVLLSKEKTAGRLAFLHHEAGHRALAWLVEVDGAIIDPSLIFRVLLFAVGRRTAGPELVGLGRRPDALGDVEELRRCVRACRGGPDVRNSIMDMKSMRVGVERIGLSTEAGGVELG